MFGGVKKSSYLCNGNENNAEVNERMSKSKLNKAIASRRVYAKPSHKDKDGNMRYDICKMAG